MRRLLLLGALCTMCVLALAPASWATSYAYGSCAEIPTQEMAQNTLDSPDYSTLGADEDELNLDPDGDGVACNNPGNLVGGEAPEEPEAPTQGDQDCVDFTSQAEAQETYDADPTDPNGLDADGNGLACESDIEDVAPGPTGQETPQPGGAAYDGYQYAPESSDMDDVVEEAAEEADVAEKEDASPPQGGAGEEEANAPGGNASGGSVSGGIAELPATGGVSLALGAGALLLAGGLVARRIVK